MARSAKRLHSHVSYATRHAEVQYAVRTCLYPFICVCVSPGHAQYFPVVYPLLDVRNMMITCLVNCELESARVLHSPKRAFHRKF